MTASMQTQEHGEAMQSRVLKLFTEQDCNKGATISQAKGLYTFNSRKLVAASSPLLTHSQAT